MGDLNDLTQNISIHDDVTDAAVTTTTTGSRVGLDTSVFPISLVDSNNTTTTPLGISGVFTGTWTNITEFVHLSIQVLADEDSATDGMEIQWSTDGINVVDEDKFSLLADAGKVWTFGCQAPYYRLKFTNGTTAQSSFNMMALLKTAYQKASSHRIADQISNQDDAELVKAVLTGEDDDGTFQNVRTDSRGNLFTTVAKVITPVHEYDGFNNDTTKISYTVPAGKKLWISGWNLAAVSDASGHAFALRIDSTQISWCCVNNDGTTTINRLYTDSNPYGPVSAGSVVTVQRIEGSSPENWGAELDGFLEDA